MAVPWYRKAQRRKKRRPKPFLKPLLYLETILAWADAYFARAGRWPVSSSGTVAEAPQETWRGVDSALRVGVRGLLGGSSLARFLAERRSVRNLAALPPFTHEQILEWADAYRARTGAWPRHDSGPIPEAPGETWHAVVAALVEGYRGLPGGSSLPRLLAERRGARNPLAPPPLTFERILQWAEAHHGRTGQWPHTRAGAIQEAPGETWEIIHRSLLQGRRGLPGGDSLAQFLLRQRGVRTQSCAPPLSLEQILAWADVHHQRWGRWPQQKDGPIAEAPGETWSAIGKAVAVGLRGLPSGWTLGRLLAERRSARVPRNLPRLRLEQVRGWAEAHGWRTGRWPTPTSGAIEESPGLTWRALDKALREGYRGLPAGLSLYRLRPPTFPPRARPGLKRALATHAGKSAPTGKTRPRKQS